MSLSGMLGLWNVDGNNIWAWHLCWEASMPDWGRSIRFIVSPRL